MDDQSGMQKDIKDLIREVAGLAERIKDQDKIEQELKELSSAIHDKLNHTASAAFVLEVDERVKAVEKFIYEKITIAKNYGVILNFLHRYGPTFFFGIALVGSNFMSIDIAKKLPSKEQEVQIKTLQDQLNTIQKNFKKGSTPQNLV